jgi:hypothetical protein
METPNSHLNSAPGPPQLLAAVSLPRADALAVTVVQGIEALATHAAEIDRLNLASVRPNAFLSSAFLRCYARHIEYYTPGKEECLFLVHEGSRLIGCAPMRSSTGNFGSIMRRSGVPVARLGFLAPLDTEQAGLICAAADEYRVAVALLRHFCEVQRDWGMLEFSGQRMNGVLHRATHSAANLQYRARDIPVEPSNEVTLIWPDVTSYFRSLTKKMRSNISRQARRLFASGKVELILARGPVAVSAWFDAYCELDSRSWKRSTVSSIQRHPRRVQFYREIAAGRGGLEPSFIGVLLDGVLIAGMLVGDTSAYAPGNSGAWCLEMAYDAARASLGPGQLLLLLAVGEAIKRGNRFLNLLQMFAYYKHRWKAEPIEVVNVQLIRRFTLHDLRGALGDLKRRFRRARPRTTDESELDPSAQPVAAAAFPAGDLQLARKLAADACAGGVAGMLIVGRELAGNHLPFPLD